MERHYTDGTEPDVLPHYSRRCTGPCMQGRVTCPSPTACQIEAELDEDTWRIVGLAGLAVVLFVLFVGALVALVSQP